MRPSPPSRWPASTPGTWTRRWSTPGAVRWPSATRWAPPASASWAPWPAGWKPAANAGAWPPSASASARAWPSCSKTSTPPNSNQPQPSHSKEVPNMLNIAATAAEAVAGIHDGATVLIGGFGNAGQPMELIDALLQCGATDLTVVNNNAGQADAGLALLIKERRVRKIICSFPRQSDSWHFDAAYRAGEIELELVPQGNLAERIRAAGAGIGGFFTPTGYGTMLAEGKETRVIDGRGYVLESPIHADVALIKALTSDKKGNLVYRKTARNFGPIMAAAAKKSIVQVSGIVETGQLDPEVIVTPGIYVDTVVEIAPQAAEGEAH